MSQPPYSRARAPRSLLWVLPALALAALLILSFGAPIQKAAAAGSALTPVPPVVSIDDNIPVPFGAATVAVPVKLTVGTEAISAMAFSIDFDEQCLSFSTADVDQNGIYDAAVFSIPPGFSPAVSYSAADTDGELDLWIIDYSPPYATMASGAFVTLTFGVTCAPLPGQPSRTIPLLFSTNPTVSFGNPLGKDVLGESDSGSLLMIAPATLTPSLTPTEVPSETPTVVPSETPTVVPSETPTEAPRETPTTTVTPEETPTTTTTPEETPTATATATATSTATTTATSTATATVTPTATLVPLGTPIWLPMIEDAGG